MPPLIEIIGGMGDGEGRYGKYNLQLLRRAIAEEWYPLTPRDRQALVEKIRKGLNVAKTPKEIAAIGKLQAVLETLNLKRTDQMMRIVDTQEKSDTGAGTQVNVQVNVGDTQQRRDRVTALLERLGATEIPGEAIDQTAKIDPSTNAGEHRSEGGATASQAAKPA